jgi:hypothetical protein
MTHIPFFVVVTELLTLRLGWWGNGSFALASNDGPLGFMASDSYAGALREGMGSSIWYDLNFLGFSGGTASIDVSYLLMFMFYRLDITILILGVAYLIWMVGRLLGWWGKYVEPQHKWASFFYLCFTILTISGCFWLQLVNHDSWGLFILLFYYLCLAGYGIIGRKRAYGRAYNNIGCHCQ